MAKCFAAERNGWRLYVHRAFGDALDRLAAAVEELKKRQPDLYTVHPKAEEDSGSDT